MTDARFLDIATAFAGLALCVFFVGLTRHVWGTFACDLAWVTIPCAIVAGAGGVKYAVKGLLR